MRMTNFLEGEGVSQPVSGCMVLYGSMKHICDDFTCLIKVLLAVSGLCDSLASPLRTLRAPPP